MLFNSFEYIFAFLPLTVFFYFILNRMGRTRTALAWLLLSNLGYYAYIRIEYVPILVASVLVNFGTGMALQPDRSFMKKMPRLAVLWAGIVFNLLLLGYFKYSDFFITSINAVFGLHAGVLKLILPMGISYFTFSQIAFIVSSYKGITRERDILRYGVFAGFFPQMLTGPISYHGEIVPQLVDPERKALDYDNVIKGVLIFSIGLFKKTMIADNLSAWAVTGFDQAPVLNFFEAWFTSLSYTFQLYFDFSGCTDMAIGSALLLNIRLPLNFNSPYKALSIQDYWRRFHITLIRFLRDHIYVPLGGSRLGSRRLYFNIVVIFVVAAVWHGTTWAFIAWGLLSSVAMITHRIWSQSGRSLNRYLAWFLTFNFVNVANMVFRSATPGDFLKIARGMLGLDGVMLPGNLAGLTFLEPLGIRYGNWLEHIGPDRYYLVFFLVGAAVIAFTARNAMELSERIRPTLKWALFVAFVFSLGVLNLTQVQQFLYFHF